MRPDPTFYPSPFHGDAGTRSKPSPMSRSSTANGNGKRDAMGVIDLDPRSSQ